MDLFLNIKSKPKTFSNRKKNISHQYEHIMTPKNNVSPHLETNFLSFTHSAVPSHRVNAYSITNKYTSHRINKYLSRKTTSKSKSKISYINNNMYTFNKIKPNETNQNISIDSNEENQIINNLNKGIEMLPTGNFIINVTGICNNTLINDNNNINNAKNKNYAMISKNKDKVIFTSGKTKKTESTSITNVSASDYYNTSFASIQQTSSNINNYNNKAKIISMPFVKNATIKKNELNNTCANVKTNTINYMISLPIQKVTEISSLLKRRNCLYSDNRYINTNKSTSLWNQKSPDKKESSHSSRSNYSYNNKTKKTNMNNNNNNNIRKSNNYLTNSEVNFKRKGISNGVVHNNKKMLYVNKILKIKSK